MMSLPLMAYSSVLQEAQHVEIARGFGAAALLLVLVLLLFATARRIGGRGAGQITPAQWRRRAAASRHDLARFQRRLQAAEAAWAAQAGQPERQGRYGSER